MNKAVLLISTIVTTISLFPSLIPAQTKALREVRVPYGFSTADHCARS